MKMAWIIGAAALAGATLAFTTAMPLQDAKAKSRGDEKKAEHAAGMDEAAMMEAWTKAATPGPQHAELAKWVGTWQLHVKHWMDPAAPPEESDATSKFESKMGGRYVIETANGSTPMGPFEGMGIMGFDNVTQQYVNIWMDNMGTGVMTSHGTANESGGYAMQGEYPDPMAGGMTKFRSELKVVSPNERTFTMWEDRGGSEVKTMEITYTRGQGGAR